MRYLKKILFISVLLLLSCAREDRSGCPCYLCFSHDGFDFNGYRKPVRVCVYDGGNLVLREEYTRAALEEDASDVPSPRSYVDVSCLGGIKNMSLKDGSSLMIPFGHECDTLYATSDKVDAVGERAKVYGVMHKQYARVRMEFEKSSDFTGSYAVRVFSNTAGVDVLSLKPVAGAFEYLPFTEDGSLFSFNLPRQIDNSLYVELWGSIEGRDTGGRFSEENYELYQTIELGYYISEELGYDWNVEDLPDIDVFIDFARVNLIVSIADWDIVAMIPIVF